MTATVMNSAFTMDATDSHLCELLRALEIAKPENASPDVYIVDNDYMMVEHDGPSTPSSPSFQGCEFLQSIHSQLDNFPTTGGAYIESIFTHRQIFFAYPGGHLCCAKAFSDLACSLQRREWRADRDSDMEAVTAFNYEAQFIASVVS
ncbi:hypothetical protein MIND_00032000 [Mycena indigotica]|uniref:Uncharacterized protein n=1 Tax=Mycena indigotica TaxID=2126181 RepID=A0A8H6TEC1_9AGAR|nr:uncharacterized protein MIND_00032000 [Mycena indigotica]KAF7315176.1 hypothetical protein MIND_00032000 [Mycena indigotica]